MYCSYEKCRASGVKFCFCIYCRIPVSKRNFRVRHHHFGDDEQKLTSKAAVATAQEKVDEIKAEIVEIEAEVSELQKKGRWMFPKKQKGWVPDPKAVAKIGLLKAKISEKWVEQGCRKGALESAKAVLSLASGTVDSIPIDSDPRIAVVLSKSLVENGVYITMEKTVAEAQKRAEQFGDLTQAIADGVKFVQIHGVSCEFALSECEGSKIGMTIDYTFREKRNQKELAVDLTNPTAMAGELCRKMLPFTGKSSKADKTDAPQLEQPETSSQSEEEPDKTDSPSGS